MTNRESHTAAIEEYVSTALLNHFGSRPESIQIILRPPFMVMHLTDFSLPNEKALLKQNHAKQVLKTRDVLLGGLKTELAAELPDKCGMAIDGLYADWNINNKTGLLLAVANRQETHETVSLNETEKALLDVLVEASKKTEKKPDHTGIHWLSESVLLIERTGLMVDIETELVKNGSTEELRLAKRPLEHRLMESAPLEAAIGKPIRELFVDWDFEEDRAYMVLLLEASSK
ncbi:Na-translocating system protein MpsC family protein [Planococcus lenghuensis]|uniref:Na+-translocating membrane potential-generating system MpsC domain-containing protein n=1 Tax=Planococcus lenghuensis TaxID=2213202 RepID=A0A1Q2KZR1_9BACL|nr:Na-translocating system protein MpsC family protein [Planococcus lenghuensis]AQQ53307.1 hypothetical protein B0X71_09605 [Planococcus lenghuensis]